MILKQINKFANIFLIFIFLPIAGLAQVEFSSSNLPVVIIDTHGQTIPMDDPRIVADMDIIYNGSGQRNNVTDQPNNYSGKIDIEIRGSSSAGWDKKSYGLETQNEDSTDRNVSLLDLPEESDWILYAPYYDRSLMRNVLVYKLSNEMGWYASRTRYCELILNDEYQGIYVLMEKIKRDKNRVDIAKLNPDEIFGDDLTGGYIIRVDKYDDPVIPDPGFDSPYPPFDGSTHVIRYQYRYPKDDNIVPEQETYIKEWIHSFETVMYEGDYSNPVSGYANYLDVSSFIDHIILNEFSRNVDGYRLSAYLYKDKDSDGGKLHAGPAWDYNFSFGNVGYHESWLSAGWQLLYFADNEYFHQNDSYQMPFWWKPLFTDPTFSGQLVERWQQLRQTILSKDSIFQTIDMFADSISEARVRNFQIWPGPGETDLGGGWFPNDPRSAQINSYEDELFLFKNWISERIDWMDENIPLLTFLQDKQVHSTPGSFELQQNYPNPFNPVTTISYNLPEAASVSLSVYNRLGQIVTMLVNEKYQAGFYTIDFNAAYLASGVYFYKLSTGNGYVQTKKMILIR